MEVEHKAESSNSNFKIVNGCAEHNSDENDTNIVIYTLINARVLKIGTFDALSIMPCYDGKL